MLTKVLGQPFQIVDVEQKEGKELPPRLFDLTSLQVIATRSLVSQQSKHYN